MSTSVPGGGSTATENDIVGPPKNVLADLLGVGGARWAKAEVQRHALQEGVDPQLLGLGGGDAALQALPEASGLYGFLRGLLSREQHRFAIAARLVGRRPRLRPCLLG